MDVGIRSLVGLLVDCPHNWPRKGDQFIVTLVVGSWVLNIVAFNYWMFLHQTIETTSHYWIASNSQSQLSLFNLFIVPFQIQLWEAD